MEKLSVVIITFNEERNIERCIKSVSDIADEIVVVDSLSTDSTIDICKKYNVKVIEQKFLGYIEQKNFALKFASNDFVLSLDADEAVSQKLKESILKAKEHFEYSGYTMNRLTNYCGKWIYHCGWYPDTKLRLFNRKRGKWGGINPHDKFMLDENNNVKHLDGDLHHYSYYTVNEHYKQTERFSTIASQSYYNKGKKANLIKLWFGPIIRFVRDYIFLLGFLDGKEGLQICYISAKGTYDKYKRLRNLWRQNL